jgi:hypothetical protein
MAPFIEVAGLYHGLPHKLPHAVKIGLLCGAALRAQATTSGSTKPCAPASFLKEKLRSHLNQAGCSGINHIAEG